MTTFLKVSVEERVHRVIAALRKEYLQAIRSGDEAEVKRLTYKIIHKIHFYDDMKNISMDWEDEARADVFENAMNSLDAVIGARKMTGEEASAAFAEAMAAQAKANAN